MKTKVCCQHCGWVSVGKVGDGGLLYPRKHDNSYGLSCMGSVVPGKTVDACGLCARPLPCPLHPAATDEDFKWTPAPKKMRAKYQTWTEATL